MDTESVHTIKGRTAVQIAGEIEAAIGSGTLAPGSRLPTVRGLAERLSVSPATVSAAYASLRGRGLLVARGRRGTRVAARPPLATGPQTLPLPKGVANLRDGNPNPALLPGLGPALRSIDPGHHLYGEELIEPELLRRSRASFRRSGIPDQHITVTGGAMVGIERGLQAHLRPGDRVAVEDPGFSGVLQLLPALGLAPVPVAIDDSGPLPDALEAALEAGVQAFILTPRAQNPMGSCLDEKRATQLRRVLARHPQVLVIEDDHGGSVAGASAISLCDGSLERWLVIRSMSKVYGPDLRLALVAGDGTTIGRMEGRQLVGSRWVSFLLQRLTVALWKDERLRADIRRARREYASRRKALIDALASHGIEGHGRSGFNVWIEVPAESPVVQGLVDRGWAVAAGERFRLQSAPAIRVTISTLEPRDAERLASDLAALLSPAGRTLTA